jgi:hypothetical protein
VAVRPYRQVNVWFWNSELLEEDIRHIGVVMLASVYQRLPDARLPNGSQNGGRFHEIRSCTYNVQDVHEPFTSFTHRQLWNGTFCKIGLSCRENALL